MHRFIIVLFFSLAIAGCTEARRVADFVAATATAITSPVDQVNIYRVKNVYDIAGKAAVRWRVTCWSKPYAALIADPVYRPICENRRPRLRAIMAADLEASALISAAERSGGDAVMTAWNAVNRFQSTIPATP